MKRHIFDVDEKNATEMWPGSEPPHGSVFAKGYAGQHLYRPAAGTCLTRGDLMTRVKNGEKFVIAAGTTNDITLLYHPIIAEH
jgi:polyhydroxyalkanoate synthesis regulator protein